MHVRRALALTAVVPLLLAGCSEGEPTPKMPDPPPASSSTPSPSATETAEAESAEEFIRRWVKVNTEMQNSGEVAEYVAMSSRCKPCRQTADRVQSIYRSGGFVRTDGWMINRVIDRTSSVGQPVLDLRISSSPTEFRESADAKTQSLAGGSIVMRVRLTRSAPWQVVQLTQLAS